MVNNTKQQRVSLSDDQLQQIRERVENATPGPWEKPSPVGDMVYQLNDRSDAGLIAVCERVTDAAFIAHAREDITALLADHDALKAEVERLQRRVQALQDEITMSHERLAPTMQEYDRMRDIVQVVGSGQIRGATLGDGECLLHNDCWPVWETITPAPNETGYWRHHPDCPVTAAYAFMAKQPVKEQQPDGKRHDGERGLSAD